MNRTVANIIIDLIAVLLFLGMIATGYLLRFALPPGSDTTLVLWGCIRYQWGNLHLWISLGFLAVLVVHIALHWNWIVTVVGKRCRLLKPSLIRSGILTALVVMLSMTLFMWSAHDSVKELSPSVPINASSATVQAPIGPESIEFWQDVYPIFETNCLSCHGPQRQLGGFRVDRSDYLFGSGERKPWILPGQSAISPLIALVSAAKKDMPMADTHTLSEQDITRLKAWIDSGAKWPVKTGAEK